MKLIIFVHILAGGLGLILGSIALSASKGMRLHRKSGLLFVYAMLTMSLSGAAMAAATAVEASVIGGVLAAYLVLTALTTVRPLTAGSRRIDLGAMMVALALGIASISLGFATLASGEVQRDGIPVAMIMIFGHVALLAGISDIRVIRSTGLHGRRRLARHLWRMSFALFIATGSFFLGQADELPSALQIPLLLAIPAFLPLLLIPYWQWRVRSRGSAYPTGLGRAAEATPLAEAAA